MKEQTPGYRRTAPTLTAQRRAAAERRAAALRRADGALAIARLQQLEAEAPNERMARAWASIRRRRAALLEQDAEP